MCLSIPDEGGCAVRGVDWVTSLDLVLCGVRPAGQVWPGSVNKISNMNSQKHFDHDQPPPNMVTGTRKIVNITHQF